MVREATHVQTGFKVAIKIYDKYKLNQNALIKISVQREIKMLGLVSGAYTKQLKKEERLCSPDKNCLNILDKKMSIDDH